MFRRTLLVVRLVLSLFFAAGFFIGFVPASASAVYSPYQPLGAEAISPRMMSFLQVSDDRGGNLPSGDGSLWPTNENLSRGMVWLPLVVIQSAPTQVTVTLTAVADACILEGYPTFNTGATSDMWVGYDDYLNPDGRIVRSLVRFDLNRIPSSVEVTEAKLRLYHVSYWEVPGFVDTATAYRATADWQEMGVTWQTRPGYGTAYGSVDVPADDAWGWYTLDVTELVKDWVSKSILNQGIVLRGPESSGSLSSWRGFSTRQGPYPPELVVSYRVIGAAVPSETSVTPSRASESITDLLLNVAEDKNSTGHQLRSIR